MSHEIEEPEVQLKDPWLAAVLAFLVPGLGHFYQRRFFKGVIYSVCILGLWVWGMQVSGWRINQAPVNRPGVPRSKTFSFLAQAGVGAPAIYAWYQARRVNNGAGQIVTSLPGNEEISSPMTGILYRQEGDDDVQIPVEGTINLATAQGRFGDLTMVGVFIGTTATGEQIDLRLGEGTEIGPEVMASTQRLVYAPVMDSADANAARVGTLQGTMPRGFWNWFQAPLDEAQEQELHGELGKMHELALVFTWIAGLLNLLAIWDALEGPAYGYGLIDETDEDESESAKPDADKVATESVSSQTRKAG